MKFKAFTILKLMIGLSLILSTTVFTQNKVMPIPEQNYYSLNPTGNTSNQMPTTVQPPVKEVPAHEKELLRKLDYARLNNDVATKEQAEKELDAIHGSITVQLTSGQNGLTTGINKFIGKNNPPFEPDYSTTPINTGSSLWAISTCTNPVGFPNAGRIWCVYTIDGGTSSDTMKTVYSDDGGSTWIQYAELDFSNFIFQKFRSSELKVIPVYDGTNMYLFIVTSFNARGVTYSVFYKYNVTTGIFWGDFIIVGGEFHIYNPRICTDNYVYTSNEYVYIVASMDSATTGGNHQVMQKFGVLLNPGATYPVITYRGPNLLNGSFWWHSEVPADQYLSSDIAFYKDNTGTGINRIMTVYNLNYGGNVGTNNIYLAWSDDFGLTNAGSLILTKTDPTRGARIAFNGGGSSNSPNRNGMIVYYSLFAGRGSDWDYLSYNTTTGGTTTGAWISKNIDNSTYHVSGHPDVIAEWGANNLFKAGYTQDSGGVRGFYSGFDGTSWSSPSHLDVTGLGADTTYTCVNPGYKNGGGADNIAFYSKTGGIGIYSTNVTTKPTGITSINNEIPKSYSLSQNYPNPFNPVTTIKFSIPKNSDVKLIIYDLTGREIAILVEGQLKAGNYSYNYNAANIASGVYFYKILAGEFSEVKKMLLVK